MPSSSSFPLFRKPGAFGWRLPGYFETIAWLRRAFREGNDFNISALGKRIPRCRFRKYQAEDLEAVSQIYLLNEQTFFPPGGYSKFCDWLEDPDNLVLVCEEGTVIRAVGGISQIQGYDPKGQAVDFAYLGYGMVHPEHHGKGFGTALLAVRLGFLPRPLVGWKVNMTSAGITDKFYARFGFTRTGSQPYFDGVVLQLHEIWLDEFCWRFCRYAVGNSSVEFHGTLPEVPNRAISMAQRMIVEGEGKEISGDQAAGPLEINPAAGTNP